MPRLPAAPALEWKDGAPRALAFDDVYFSRDGGLAESETVFLGGCGLPDGWRARDQFAICELGFGCGLNVLAAWRAWKDTHKPHAVLHICSIEAFPLAKEDAARALAPFQDVGSLAARLLARWPVRAYAPQRLWFEDDGVALTLFTGEAESVLANMTGRFDAWFLDGFAPARNSKMWSSDVFAHIARLSAPAARLATYSVAGGVRRALEANGFTVEKRPGFAAKRERLEATRIEGVSIPEAARPKRVAIIGAGIAGAACAHALARRGVETVVLEAARDIGAGASGNPAGLVMPRLDRGGALSEVFLSAYIEAVATYEQLGVLVRCGVEERAEPRRAEALADLIADPPLPPDWFGATAAGALHARAGLVRPLEAIGALLAGAQLQCEAPVQALERSGEGWVLRAADGAVMLKADAVVLACGTALTRFEATKFLPIELSRGQIEWGRGNAPAHALTRGSYVAPFEGGVLFGATFDKLNDAAGPAIAASPGDSDSRTRNLAALAQLAPDIAVSIDVDTLCSRAALRAATPDRAPLAGALPDAPKWFELNADVAHGAAPKASPVIPGVYVIGGLGARGLTLAPLLGEQVAAEICSEPRVLSATAAAAIDPARFLHRTLKRR